MADPIRILSVAWSLPGGGISHVIGSIDKLKFYDDVELYHVVIRMPAWQIHKGIWNRIKPEEIIIEKRMDPRWLPRLIRIAKRKRISVLMVHDFHGFIIGGLCKLFGLRIPVLATYHVPYIPDSTVGKKLSLFINKYSSIFLKYFASKVITVADRYRVDLTNQGISSAKIVTVHNGIKNNFVFNPAVNLSLRKTALFTDSIIIGTTTRLHPQKGLEYLIQAMPSVINKYPHVRLTLLGSGNSESQLKELVKTLGLSDHVHFMGFQENTDDWLNAFDIFVLPSLAEGHSISLLEAMRASLPIICTSVGDNLKTVYRDKEALVVPPKDVAALETALNSIIEDVELRKRLALAAKDRFEKEFTEDHMVLSTYHVVKNTVNEYHGK